MMAGVVGLVGLLAEDEHDRRAEAEGEQPRGRHDDGQQLPARLQRHGGEADGRIGAAREDDRRGETLHQPREIERIAPDVDVQQMGQQQQDGPRHEVHLGGPAARRLQPSAPHQTDEPFDIVHDANLHQQADQQDEAPEPQCLEIEVVLGIDEIHQAIRACRVRRKVRGHG